jgi:hypothetical protein
MVRVMSTLSDIRERDAAWNAEEMERLPAIVDRRYLLSLIDAYQAREREARELLRMGNTEGCDCALCVRSRTWLAAPRVEGEPSA